MVAERRGGGASELVVLVHGLAANRLVMAPLAYRLKRAGFATFNWGYPSICGGIEQHAGALRRKVEQLASDPAIDKIHVVGHSMGSIITRQVLHEGLPAAEKFGRVVMLAPPNHGSPVARWLEGWLSPICKPLAQLSDRPDSFVNRLPAPQGVHFGVIAAAGDLMVPRASTPLDGQEDYRLLPGMHSELPWRRDAARLVASFLRHGCFDETVKQSRTS